MLFRILDGLHQLKTRLKVGNTIVNSCSIQLERFIPPDCHVELNRQQTFSCCLNWLFSFVLRNLALEEKFNNSLKAFPASLFILLFGNFQAQHTGIKSIAKWLSTEKFFHQLIKCLLVSHWLGSKKTLEPAQPRFKVAHLGFL